MQLESIDWAALDRLRRSFLDSSAGERDYWQSETDLASYDQTFAQRIGWKWDYVLGELTRRGWRPPVGPLLDWGCGSGIAGRAALHHFGSSWVSEVLLWDRSPMAVQFAQRRLAESFPSLSVRGDDGAATPFETLLLSHVLTELQDAQIEQVLALAARATSILWIEPGTHSASRKLSEVRERLAASHQMVAPCTHQRPCPMFDAANAQHWCHHFANPPPGVFTDGNWARFAALAGIDLRSLPLSFLVADKRPVPPVASAAERIVGRPRVYKGYALLLGCSGAGLRERRLTKRILPELFRQVKKGEVDPVQAWTCRDDEIVGVSSGAP